VNPIVAGVAYFAVVFIVGGLLGPIREFILAPAFGATTGVLIEAPIMLAVMWLTAHALVARLPSPSVMSCLVLGCVGLTLVIVAEAWLTQMLRGMTFQQYVASFTPGRAVISLGLYVVFALVPLLVRRT
jgi:hypothetical protein